LCSSPRRLNRNVFFHVFDSPTLPNRNQGARIKKLRQGTLARKQTLWHCARLHVQDLMPGRRCRRSSGVERAIGNGEADSSILSGGTIYFNDLACICPPLIEVISSFGVHMGCKTPWYIPLETRRKRWFLTNLDYRPECMFSVSTPDMRMAINTATGTNARTSPTPIPIPAMVSPKAIAAIIEKYDMIKVPNLRAAYFNQPVVIQQVNAINYAPIRGVVALRTLLTATGILILANPTPDTPCLDVFADQTDDGSALPTGTNIYIIHPLESLLGVIIPSLSFNGFDVGRNVVGCWRCFERTTT
jgi:hypothetical protein